MKNVDIYAVILAVLKTAALFASFMAVQLVVSLIWALLAGIENYPESVDVSGAPLQLLGGLAFIWFLRRFYKKRENLSLTEDSGFVRNRFTSVKLLPLYALYGLTLNLLVVIFLNTLPSSWTAAYNENVLDSISKGNPIIVCLSIVVYSPVIEEFLFRGFAFKTLTACVNPWITAGILSVIFGLIHTQPVWVAYTMALGMVFSWLVMRTGSVIPSVITHIFFNAASLGLLLISIYKPRWIAAPPGWLIGPALVVCAAAAAVLTVGIHRFTGRDTVADTA